MIHTKRKNRTCFLLLLFLLLFTGCRPAAPGPASETNASASAGPASETAKPPLTLTFINIGKGDAFLLTMPDGSHYMIDTGKKSDFDTVQRLLLEKHVDSLEGVFLSHGHKDHSGGLKKILKSGVPIDTIFWLPEDDVSYDSLDVKTTAEKYDCVLHPLRAGDSLILSDAQNKVTVDVLGPETIDKEKGNNNSLILRIRYGGTTFLMMGDAELPEVTALLRSGQDVKADVLKVGHHGKKDAYSPEFLEAVSPSYAILTGNTQADSKSNNPKVLRHLHELGCQNFLAEGDYLAVDFISDSEQISTAVIGTSK